MVLAVSASARAQQAACPAVPDHALTPAETAYSEAQYHRAEDLYGAALAQHPGDMALSAAMVHTQLHLGEISQAAALADKMLAADAHSAVALAALAEVQLRQGQPWAAMDTLADALKADQCNARAHLIRSRVLRLDSMYGSERAELDQAYQIDPHDPDIQHTWLGIVQPAHEIEGIVQGLTTMKDLDADMRQKAEGRMQAMMPMLMESSQTCQGPPSAASATLPLQITASDPKHIQGYRLEVKFPQTAASLTVDTAASGMYINRQLADQNHLEARAGDPLGTVHADSVQIGPLEFHDCMVGVSDTPFPNHGDGFIGTDIFAQYLITLDLPVAKMTLAPLPVLKGALPGDRTIAPELKDYTPVYHRKQFLLVPVTLDNKARELFVLDTGIRLSTMTSEVAHSVSTTKINFTNPMQTAGGGTVQIYRDSFDFRYANLLMAHQSGVLEFDPAAIDESAGVKVAGMLGFDMLHTLVLHLDYRDGLVKLDSANADLQASPERAKESTVAGQSAAPECDLHVASEQSMVATIGANVTGLLDAAHLKPGKEIFLKAAQGWQDTDCRLEQGANLYGHVTAASAPKGSGAAELALQFDHVDCEGHPNKPITLRVLGLVGPLDVSAHLHDALPVEVAGGVRSINDAVAGTTAWDPSLNPGGMPNTIKPGVVIRVPGVKLEPLGGPGCSDKFSSQEHALRLAPGMELVLIRETAL